MNEDLIRLIKGFQYMYPRLFSLSENTPVEVIKENGGFFLGKQELFEWTRLMMGGDRGIHISDE